MDQFSARTWSLPLLSSFDGDFSLWAHEKSSEADNDSDYHKEQNNDWNQHK